jgi:hypothetical protein
MKLIQEFSFFLQDDLKSKIKRRGLLFEQWEKRISPLTIFFKNEQTILSKPLNRKEINQNKP